MVRSFGLAVLLSAALAAASARHGDQVQKAETVTRSFAKNSATHAGANRGGHGLRQYTQGQSQATSGFEVLGITFNSSCMSSGCWNIDIKYNLAPNAITVLYIPKTSGDDALENGGAYPDSVSATFEPKNFPCGVMGAGSANACCLQDVLQSYRTPANFQTAMSTVDFSACPSSLLSSGILHQPDHSGGFLAGKFADMPLSEVVLIEESSDGWQGSARLRLDEKEVRTLAGQIHGHASVEYTLTTFIGMASFVPTRNEDGGWSTFLQSYHTQTPITFMKKSFAQVVVNGGFSQTFLNYVGTVLHNVHIADGVHADENAQFIQVSFTMPARYTPAGGELIPFSSVRVGKGNSSSNVGEWFYPCDTSTADVPTIYGEAGMAAVYEDLSQATCAPPVDMCAQPMTMAKGFVSYQFPLGLDFFEEKDVIAGTSIFLEFVVSVEDADSKLSSSTVMVDIPLEQAGHVNWCQAESASTDLLNVANVDIIIGTATSQGQLDSQLTVLQNVLHAGASADSSSNSLQSGLISVVLKGADTYFELPRAKNFFLELEDVVSLHFLETTTTRFDAVNALMRDGLAFETVIDGEGSGARANINPTIALTDLCPEDGSDMSCLTRRDVYKRASSMSNSVIGSTATHGLSALEINPDTTEEAKSFMQHMLSTTSAWASSLATQYSDVLASKYALNSRSKRAWWINPGRRYAESSSSEKYILPSRIMLVMLVNINEDGYARRRALVAAGGDGFLHTKAMHAISPKMRHARKRAGTSSSSPDSATSSKISYNVNPAEQMVTALGVDKTKSTTFQVEYEIPEEIMCLSQDEAKKKLGQTLLASMQRAADVENVLVTSFSVPAESMAGCKRRLHHVSRSLKAANTVAKIEMLVVFRTTNMVINKEAFLQIPGMLSLTPTDPGHAVKIDDTYVPPAVGAPALPFEADIAQAPKSSPISTAVACTAAVLFVASLAGAVFITTRKAVVRKVKDADIEPSKFSKKETESDCSAAATPNAKAGAPCGPGVRLRRSNSNEEMMHDQEMGVATLERSSSGDAIRKIALTSNSVISGLTDTASRDSSVYNTKSSSGTSAESDTAQRSKASILAQRFAYIKGHVLGLEKPSGAGSSADEEAKIDLALDLDWRMRGDSLFSSTTDDACASPTHSYRSRSTSPLLGRYDRTSGQTSPNGSFSSRKYRADLASRELRRELGKLQSAFDVPEEITGPEAKLGCSVKALKEHLRVLGVTDEEIRGCMEKSDLEALMMSAAKPIPAPAEMTAQDVEDRLFRTESDDKRVPERLSRSHAI